MVNANKMLCEGKVWRMIWTPVPVNHVQTLLWLWSFMPCHAYCHACLIFVRYQSWLFHSSSKNVSYIKAATSTLTRRGTSLKSPCHTTTKFEISAQCVKQSRRQLVFFGTGTFFYLVNNFQKVLQMCLPQRRHEKLIPSSLSNRLHSFFVFHLCSSGVGL